MVSAGSQEARIIITINEEEERLFVANFSDCLSSRRLPHADVNKNHCQGDEEAKSRCYIVSHAHASHSGLAKHISLGVALKAAA